MKNLLVIMHPGYQSLSINMAIIFLLKDIFLDRQYLQTKYLWKCISLPLLIILSIMLLSRIGIVVTFLSIIIFLGIYAVKFKYYLQGIIGIVFK